MKWIAQLLAVRRFNVMHTFLGVICARALIDHEWLALVVVLVFGTLACAAIETYAEWKA